MFSTKLADARQKQSSRRNTIALRLLQPGASILMQLCFSLHRFVFFLFLPPTKQKVFCVVFAGTRKTNSHGSRNGRDTEESSWFKVSNIQPPESTKQDCFYEQNEKKLSIL